MDIKEAIAHARAVAEGCPAGDRDCAYQHDHLADWLEELASYKDTGLEPERVRELAEAEKAGRLVVLPCKVGDSLWIHDRDGKPREMLLDPPDIRCHCADEDNLCMALCSAKRTGVCAYRLKNDASDIGKTVFLTRQEAGAALGKEETT